MNIKHIGISALALGLIGAGSLTVTADAAPINPTYTAQATSIPNTKGAVTGWHVKDGSLYCADLGPGMCAWLAAGPANNSVNTYTVKDGSLGEADLNKALADKVNDNRQAILADGIADAVVINKIGGPIADNGTKLGIDLVVPAGDYVAQVSGQIDRTTDAATPGKQTQPQLSLWLDDNNDGIFQWQTQEGSISPNALVPDLKGRSATVNGQTLISLDTPTHVKLIAFGYNNDGSAAGSGELTVSDATVVLTPVK